LLIPPRLPGRTALGNLPMVPSAAVVHRPRPYLVVVESDRRPAHARSRITAAVAATRAAARAITVICQPGMPPMQTSGAAAGPYGPSTGIGMIAAEAAGTIAVQASRPPVAAATAAMIRRRRAAICG
jgi:hypothetical protein